LNEGLKTYTRIST